MTSKTVGSVQKSDPQNLGSIMSVQRYILPMNTNFIVNQRMTLRNKNDTPGEVDILHPGKARGRRVCGQVLRKKDEKNFENRVKKACNFVKLEI